MGSPWIRRETNSPDFQVCFKDARGVFKTFRIFYLFPKVSPQQADNVIKEGNTKNIKGINKKKEE